MQRHKKKIYTGRHCRMYLYLLPVLQRWRTIIFNCCAGTESCISKCSSAICKSSTAIRKGSSAVSKDSSSIYMSRTVLVWNATGITLVSVPPIATCLPGYIFGKGQEEVVQAPSNDDIVVNRHQERHHHACKSNT